jgi:hypothetical protein
MDTVDADSGQTRGFLLVRRADTAGNDARATAGR